MPSLTVDLNSLSDAANAGALSCQRAFLARRPQDPGSDVADTLALSFQHAFLNGDLKSSVARSQLQQLRLLGMPSLTGDLKNLGVMSQMQMQ